MDHVKPIIDDVIEEIKSVSILVSKLAHQKYLNKTLNFSITFFDNVHCRLIVDDDQCHSTRCYLYDYEQIDDIMIICSIFQFGLFWKLDSHRSTAHIDGTQKLVAY